MILKTASKIFGSLATAAMMFPWIVICGSLAAASSVSAATETSIPRFQFVEGKSVIVPELMIHMDTMVGQAVTYFGRLDDTGTENIFFTFEFDGDVAHQRSWPLKRRIFFRPQASIWVKISGTFEDISTRRWSKKYVLSANSYEELSGYNPLPKEVLDTTCALVDNSRSAKFLNKFKKLRRFQEAFSSLENIDLNTTPFQPGNSLVFIDFEQKVAGLLCGRRVLQESPAGGEYLSYLAVYDLDKHALQKVNIVNTGFPRE